MTERERNKLLSQFESMTPELREEILADIMYRCDVNQNNVGDLVAEKIGNAVREEVNPQPDSKDYE